MDKEILEILKRIETKVDNLEIKVDNLEAKADEHTLILRALEHSTQANKAEHDKMFNDIAKIQGDVIGIKKGLSQVELVTANNWADIVNLKAVK